MDAAEFDRLVARARDPRLIPGVYNYCDGRCQRCPLTQRCLAYLDSQDVKVACVDQQSSRKAVGDSLRRAVEMLKGAARRGGVGLNVEAKDDAESAASDL